MQDIAYNAADVTILILSSLVLAILMVSLVLQGDARSKQGRMFLIVLVLTCTMLVFDMVSWFCDTVPGEPYRTVNVVASLFAYVLAMASLLSFVMYIALVVSEKSQETTALVRVIKVAAIAVFAAMMVALVASQFNGMVYSIDAQNVYRLGPFYAAFQISALAFGFLEMILVLSYAKRLGRKDTLVLLSYVYIPFIAVFIQLFVPSLMLIYASMMLSYLLIYINYQAQQSRRLKAEMDDSRIAIMLSQIQPHFLYNSLAVVENLCVEDPGRAQKTVRDFSHYLRNNLDSLSNREPIPFVKELDHIKTYLALEKERFRDRLNIEYDIATVGFAVPSLAVQPIVENAVRYGITKTEGGGTLLLRTREEEASWVVEVCDNGRGFDSTAIHGIPGEKRLHVGIENVRSRLAAQCGGSLEIESSSGAGTKVTMRIPKEAG